MKLSDKDFLTESLNFPQFEFELSERNGKLSIFDSLRKKFLILTPEEWVRQNFIRYLVSEKGFPAGLIAVEQPFIFNKMQKRSDLLVYNNLGQPKVLAECKAPSVPITSSVFEQIGLYNLTHHGPWLIVTNGIKHYCCRYQEQEGRYQFSDFIPDWSVV